MNYRDLQQALRQYKEQGLTEIALNAHASVLEAELKRLEASVTLTQIEEETVTSHQSPVTSEDIFPFETPQPTDTKEVDTVAKILESNSVHSDSGLICPECEGTGEILNDQGDYEPCHDCDGTGRLDGADTEDDESVLDALAEIVTKTLGADAILKPWLLGDGDSMRNGSFVVSDPSCSLIELETKALNFLSDVAEKRLPLDQFEAITVALKIAREQGITVAEALTQIGTFYLFSPSQLLAWGFDQIIPQTNFLFRFRDSASSPPSISVNVKFTPSPDNAGLLGAWASSYGGVNWCSGLTDSCQDEDWCFPSIESAEYFCEFCSKLDFIQSATINRIGTEQKAMVGVG